MQIKPGDFTGKLANCTFSLTLEEGYPPLCHSTSILKELFNSTPGQPRRSSTGTPLNRGRIAFKPADDLHPCSFLPDYGFYSLVNTSNRLPGRLISSVACCQRAVFFPPGRTGTHHIVSYFVLLRKQNSVKVVETTDDPGTPE